MQFPTWAKKISRLIRGEMPANMVRRTRRQVDDTMARLALEATKLAPRQVLGSSYHNRPLWPSFSSEVGLNDFESWTWICVHKTAMAFTTVPLIIQRRSGKSWEHDPEHPLGMLLDNPNPFWSGEHLRYLQIAELLLTGNSLVCMVEVGIGDSKIPANLFTLRPQRVAPIPSKDIHVAGYQVTGMDGRRYIVGAQKVVHLQFPNPEDPYWGKAPAEAGQRAHTADERAAEWQMEAINNTMVPPGAFTFPGLSIDQLEQAQEILRDNYQEAINARKPLLLSDEAKFVSMAQSAVDMDWIEGRRMTREEICAVYGTPQPIAGILADATYSNIRTARQVWWQDTLEPLFRFVAKQLTRRLVPRFGEDPSDVRIWPDTASAPAMQEVLAEKTGTAKELWTMGVPFNEAAAQVGLNIRIDHGDVGYVPANVSPVTPEGQMDEDDLSVPRPVSSEVSDIVDENVQQQAFNGAQVQALLQMIQSISDGTLSPDAAIPMLQSAFPAIPADRVERMVREAEAFSLERPIDMPAIEAQDAEVVDVDVEDDSALDDTDLKRRFKALEHKGEKIEE